MKRRDVNFLYSMFIKVSSLLCGGVLVLATSGYATASTRVPPNRSLFDVYPTHELAVDVFNRTEMLIAATENTEPRAIVPPSDPRYERIRLAMQVLWEGFTQVDPTLTAQLPIPELILVEDPTVNAYAISKDHSNSKTPYLLVVHTGSLDDRLTENEIRALMAHELTHLLTQDGRKEVKESITRYFFADPSAIGPDSDRPNDERAKRLIEEWKSLANLAGPYAFAAFNGLPSRMSASDTYYSLLSFLIDSRHVDASNPACARLKMSFAVWSGASFAFFSEFDQLLHTGPAEIANIERISSFVHRDLQNCFQGFRTDLISILAEQVQMAPNAVRDLITEDRDPVLLAEIERFSTSPDFVPTFVQSIMEKHARIREIEASPDFANARFYSYEDAADDMATLVLSTIGSDPHGSSEFLAKVMDPANRTRCTAALEAGTVPPFGVLTDDHHATCYRIYRLNRLIAYRAAQGSR